MFLPSGVYQRAIVTFNSVPPASCSTSCTLPLPKLLVPRKVATPLSLSAPAVISLAEAEPPSINTTVGRPANSPLPLEYLVDKIVEPRRSETIVLPLGNHILEI